MTTVAWDGETLAVDSRMTTDHIYYDNAKKLYEFKELTWRGDKIIGAAFVGTLGLIPQFLTHLEHDSFPNVQENNSLCIGALLLSENCIYEFENLSLQYIKYPLHVQVALGSGESFALSGMKLGLSAVDAVKHAMEFDAYTGGTVHTLKL